MTKNNNIDTIEWMSLSKMKTDNFVHALMHWCARVLKLWALLCTDQLLELQMAQGEGSSNIFSMAENTNSELSVNQP